MYTPPRIDHFKCTVLTRMLVYPTIKDEVGPTVMPWGISYICVAKTAMPDTSLCAAGMVATLVSLRTTR